MMQLPDRVPLYRWADGRSIDRVLTTDELVRLFKPGKDPASWAGLAPEINAVFVIFGLPERGPQVFYFSWYGDPVFMGLLMPTLLVYVPRVEQLQAAIWPFAEELLLPPNRDPADWTVFRSAVYLDDAVYKRAAAFGDQVPTAEDIRTIFEGYPVDATDDPWPDADAGFVINLGRALLKGHRAPTGWFLNFVDGGSLAGQEPTLLAALQAAGTTENRPRLLPASQQEAEEARIGLVAGTPLVDPAHLEAYRLLGEDSPIAWPSSERFYAWYTTVQENSPSTP